jgi:hypothetical protein
MEGKAGDQSGLGRAVGQAEIRERTRQADSDGAELNLLNYFLRQSNHVNLDQDILG